MTPSELRGLDIDELTTAMAEAKEELFNLRFQLATSQLVNTARLKDVKKDIARINTVMREREIEEWRAQQATASGKDA